ncbi:hypothetical protein [Ureibacillus sp. FSL W8-0352]|uniref:hypothetical protein n=1 Tax=Ureibacillus sp. FSL W8-0352 TaxID=2954596 RepID=UPI0030FC7DC1
MKQFVFSTSLLFFWIKGKVEVDSRFVKTNLTNTILGFIPAGKDQQSIPLKNISGSMLTSKYLIKPIILGLLIIFFALDTMVNSFIGGVIFLVIGIGILGSGIQTLLIIEKSGNPYYISVPFYEKQKLQLLSEQIHKALADDTDKTDLNLFFDRKPNT